MNPETLQTIEKLTQELLAQLQATSTIKVAENDGAVLVTIDTAEPGMLIGRHGRSLEAIQILLGQMAYKKLGSWTRVVVTVGDYRERRAQQLVEMAQTAAQRVVETHEPVEFMDLTPAERREIHMALSDHPQVASVSEGEGRDRKLVVKLKA
ncbi:MAG: putative RNA-binding protein [Candidatus Gottesmanbacteria bacterium GW2011_GWB1_43_11]|uniref:Putative RNA-binding protein n=1 Tax=Candidatus Gottesmanbacteria bacterium GW2011_GWB1_43_11 TaxID=1618446 RepID=A0A0G1EUR3_9BACT|nr:MAG: putative RNA-binding protein [Candidatus Gottesmanbacteria bacterium GW2011_GWA2_42_16]KKS55851.1 MAG: putative RNA-binding protein [Candidatus Gottesmanbacteria bacterium GW2011_GWA1_42_26]KKS81252.1 MAG: putative RNA-binding protein [Candidatus Gottesmanbacteria bacterium GW2011_GWC1_43_10]KKS86766.1 MAG: putative RNA-binding protein [Candidatus Gottesmanbacteria bacterium GW2011_GWB1_43_11]OGG09842.1 MAG: hypothetical protein A2699_00565 [Candidatus Gottesmanbacteria bacterium RIFCSP